jgi:hypothetical protein
MPKKETRESIEAELAATEVERAIARCREVVRDVQDLERRLQEQEREWGITPFPGKPLIERMAAIGMNKDVIQHVSDMLEAITRIVSNKTNEIPEGARISLAAMADAEISALDQLQDILDARRRQPRD